MPILIHGATLSGIDATLIGVEIDLIRRLPAIVIVGLPSISVRESAERVRSALLASGFEFPRQRIVVSLSPADIKKEGTGLDLPIALGILAAAGHIPPDSLERVVAVGELSLAGALRPVRGALAYAYMARQERYRCLLLPESCGQEAAVFDDLDVRAAPDLRSVIAWLRGEQTLSCVQKSLTDSTETTLDLKDVAGQPLARAALEVAAAGGHNLLMEGPPGCGKTMLASRLPGILPMMTEEEAIESTRIHSCAGTHPLHAGILGVRPFRAPHHTISIAGMVGNANARPGEISLAHNGVLFLDEFPEFTRFVIESLRAPLEERVVHIARANGNSTLPSRFMLVAAANPCPCGYWNHPTQPCSCSPPQRQRYRERFSGPILDRIDLRIELPPADNTQLFSTQPGEESQLVRSRVAQARQRQQKRYKKNISCNAEIPSDRLIELANPSPTAIRVLQDQLEQAGWSARVGKRLLKVARTIADLEGTSEVHPIHIQQAFQLRCTLDEEALCRC